MKILIPYFCLFLMCSSAKNSKDIPELKQQAREQQLQLAPVDSLSFSSTNNGVTLLLHGMLPNPAYAIERVDVRVEDNVIHVLPWMSHDQDQIVIQMTIPYEHKVDIGPLPDQEHTIRVQGQYRILARDLKSE